MPFSQDFQVMSAPSRTYAEALQAPASGTWAGMRRPALVALALGTGTAYGATGHVTLGLVASGVVCWSFAVAIQLDDFVLAFEAHQVVTVFGFSRAAVLIVHANRR